MKTIYNEADIFGDTLMLEEIGDGNYRVTALVDDDVNPIVLTWKQARRLYGALHKSLLDTADEVVS